MRMHSRQRRHRRWSYGSLGTCALALALLCPAVSQAADEVAAAAPSRLREIQAAVLYNLLSYVEGMPIEAAPLSAPIQLGILGHDPFGAALNRLGSLKAGQRSIVVRRSLNPAALAHCDLIFVADSELPVLDRILAYFAQLPKVLVSDIVDFPERGGTVGLGLVDGKISIRLNRGVARRLDMDFDVELLRLADEVLE